MTKLTDTSTLQKKTKKTRPTEEELGGILLRRK